MKDLTDFHAKDSQVAVGEGKMPVRQIFQALIDTHYKGSSIWSMRCMRMTMPGVISSFAYMRAVLDGMGYRA